MTEAPCILLVEDNPDHTELLLRCFRDRSDIDRIFHVADGEAALDYLMRRGAFSDPETSPRPYVVLLDLRLPKVDGFEVLRQLKGSPALRPIPVVILTTSKAESDLSRAYGCHANSYLVKPLDIGQFSNLLDGLSNYWLGLNQPLAEARS